MTRTPTLVAHGVGTRSDLPVPTAWAALAAAVALVISFAVLAVLWRRPRRRHVGAVTLPSWVTAAADAPATRGVLRALGVLGLVAVVVVGLAGPDDPRRNLAPWVVYVWVWVGVVPASLLLGPVWPVLDPLRGLHRVVVGTLRLPADGWVRVPDAWGVHPATVGLAGWLWVELVAPDRSDPRFLATLLVGWTVLQVGAACVAGPGWFDRADPLRVWSRLVATLAPLGRRDGRLVVRPPLDGADVTVAPGAPALLVLLVGGTAFDGLSRTSWWQTTASAGVLDATGGLVAAVLVVAVVYLAATAGPAGAAAGGAPAAFASSLVPVAVGYAVAHYFSLLVFDGQQVPILASDPWGDGADWFGTATHVVDYTVVGTAAIAAVQLGGIVGGHLLAAVTAHDRAVRLFPGALAVRLQLPLLAAMVTLTVGAVVLIGAG